LQLVAAAFTVLRIEVRPAGWGAIEGDAMSAVSAGTQKRPGVRAFWASLDGGQRRTVGMMASVIAALHVIGFVTLFLFVAPNKYSIGSSGVFTIGIGFTAYTLGMRHAFDADHISAIDNTTRKLMNEGKRPLSVGFWFSLGHSTIVFALAFLISLGVRALDGPVRNDNSNLHRVTGYIGTGVSGIFLYIIAALNIVILIGIIKVFRELKTGTFDEETLEEQLQKRGFMNRFFGKLTKTVTKPQQMYPIGVLFGLGFDTATEVALLVVAGSAGAAGLPWYAILCLPILFAAGMSLLDAIDGSFMNFAYGWAFSKPVRKVFYNLTITGLSVAVALVIGTIELAGLIASDTHLRGSFWTWFGNIDINLLGFVIVGMFVATWAIALAVWKYGHIEERWDAYLQPVDPAPVTSTDVRA
jgi:nickel/cobalt transporter (NiCoT) family protein